NREGWTAGMGDLWWRQRPRDSTAFQHLVTFSRAHLALERPAERAHICWRQSICRARGGAPRDCRVAGVLERLPARNVLSPCADNQCILALLRRAPDCDVPVFQRKWKRP